MRGAGSGAPEYVSISPAREFLLLHRAIENRSTLLGLSFVMKIVFDASAFQYDFVSMAV
jgi:hypothetical protein